ncbi:hypothetical protein QQF64_023174 [Cirrhinus molitorella]|uniref:Protein-tyrosine-phosphatase n=1 Tax=Cirrhinus molitorella TaxID=172907 RepID=A0ABR3L4Q2_9TELE
MGCLSIKTVKGTALLIFVILRGLNADSTTAPATTSFPSTVTRLHMIENLTVVEISTTFVRLKWDEPLEMSPEPSFNVQWTAEKTSGNEVTNTSCNITGLIAGVNYTFCVTYNSTASKSVCISAWTKPDVIINLTANDITTSSVLLNWAQPNGQSSHYQIEYEDKNVTTENISIEINNLTPGKQYTFKVFAVAADNVTEGRSEQTSLYTKPDIIMNLAAGDITTSSVLLNWAQPNGQSSHYRIEYGDKNVTTENISIEINNLTPGKQYTFKVFAVAADNVTEGRSEQTSLYTKPDVIMNLTANDITTSSVLLNWAQPNGQSSHYRIEYGDKNVTTENISIEINSLTPGKQYTFKVFAVAADNVTKGRSEQTSLYTKPDIIMNLAAGDITTSSVLLNWAQPNGQSSHYRIEYGDKNVTTENISIEINNLTPGKQYTFKVFAVAADNVTEGRSEQISLYTKPDVIRNLTVSEITTSSVFLRWDEPAGYKFFFTLQWTGDEESGNVTTTYTSYNITDLTAGVNYTFIIQSLAADNLTEGESVVTSTYTKPDIIMNLTADDITTSSVLLSWTKPNGQSSHYRVEYGDKNVTTENTSIKINGLTPGTQHTFKVFAVAADHVTEGRSSQTSLYTKPDVISNLTVKNITTSSVFLIWNEPGGNRHFFQIQRTGETSGDSTTTTNTSYLITNLTAGVNYTFCITAVAADNLTKGETSCTSRFTKPDVIRNLKVSEITTSSVFLRWDEPAGYRFYFTLQWTGDEKSENVTTTYTSYNITDLTAGVSYTFIIQSLAADNSTEGESVVTSTYTKPDVIMNLTADDITTSSVLLNWTKPNGQSFRYRVEYEDKNVTTENTSIKINYLTPGKQHIFKVFAVAADHVTEGRSSQISLYTKPDVISNLTVKNITTSSVFLIWNEPGGNRHFFQIQWTGDQTSRNSTTTTNTSYNITGLTAGVNYTFCITAVAADNLTKGETSCTSRFTKPDVIKNLIVWEFTTSSVFLKWDEPAGQRDFFRIWTEKTTYVTTNDTFYVIRGLTAGVSHTFCITAVAADNSTEGKPFCISKYTKPDVIRNLTVSEITTSSVFLTWNEPIGNKSFFKIKWTSDVSQTNRNSTTTNTSYHITGLIAGVSYTLCITAVAADNSTEGNAFCISQYTKPDVIRNLTVSKITTSSVFLTWKEPDGMRSLFKLQWTGDDSTTGEDFTTNTSYHITNLTAGANHTFCITTVAADNSTGETVCISQYTMPEVISNLTVNNITTSSVFLTWNDPIGYRSFFKIQWTGDQTSGNSITTHISYHITNLTAGVNHTFCITAVAADNSTEGGTVCILKFTKPNVIKNLTVFEITTSSMYLRWEEPNGKRSFFKVQWTDKKTSGNLPLLTRNTFYNITDLIAGVSYTFIITAVAADNSTEGDSAVTSKYTKPDVIMNLTAGNITTSSVLLSWTKPNGQSSHYYIEYGDKNVTTENTSIKINDLTPGAQHTFKVFAVAADNVTEGRSEQISLYTTDNSTEGEPVVTSKYTKPDVIMNLTSDDITTSSLLLNWTKPNGQSSHYRIEYEDKNVTAENTFIKINDLTPGAQHTFKVFAVAADHVTEGRSSQISLYTKPDVIRNLKEKSTTSFVFLTWDEPIGNRSFFKLQWNDDQIKENSTTPNTFFNITGLTAGVNYTFIIAAVAADNSTEGETVSISQYTKPDVIRNVTVSEITTSSIHLRWHEPAGKRDLFHIKWESEKRMYVTTNVTSYTIADLNAGTNYTVCITAMAADRSEGQPICISQYTSTKESNTAVIVGAVFGVIFFLFIITLVLFFYSRRQTKKQSPDIPVHPISNIALRIEDYEEYFRRKHADSNCGFAEEYEELKTVGTAQSKSAALAIENKAKNRYSNVLPYDSSRVKLSMCGGPFDDYINANYIPGYNSRKEFIAAQGPLPVTVNEFWRMVWEKNVYTIVMLTRCNEMGRVKCEKYWPTGTNHYHNISVETTSEIDLESWTIRDFKIKNVKTAETRYVRQFHFTAWPDHGVPETTEILIDFRHLVREHMDQYSRHSPTVVHCSAGVGRTGTFIAIDHLIFQIERDSMVDVYGIVNDMRMHRPLMVQTEEQYVYLHQCAYDIIRSRTGTNVDLIYQNAAALSIYQNVK